MGEMRFGKIHSEKVAQITQRVENDEAYVGGEVNIERGLLDGVFQERLRVVMLRDATIGLIRTMTKLCVWSSGDLLGHGGRIGVHERAVVIVFIENKVFK
jgi:hypothetical protein